MKIQDCLNYFETKGVLPRFQGICVHDAQRNDLVKKLGVTLGWVLNPERAMQFSKILVAGNDHLDKNHEVTTCGKNWHRKERGKFFIADIVKIINLNDHLRANGGMPDVKIQKHHCAGKYPMHPNSFSDTQIEWQNTRYAIFFTNPTKTYISPHHLELWLPPVRYII